MAEVRESKIPLLDLSWAQDELKKPELLQQLREALFDVGFLYIVNHGVPESTIDNLVSYLPRLFALPPEVKQSMSKINSPHFLGYNGFAEEKTLGKQDLREQFDFASELPVIWQDSEKGYINGHSNGHVTNQRDFSKLYWRLRGPNQWPPENLLPGFREAFTEYHDAVEQLSYRFVHLVEEAFGIPVGTCDHFWRKENDDNNLAPQHRIKLLRYPPNVNNIDGQGVGPHKDSSGWLTFLYQVGEENALEVLGANDEWIPAPPMKGSLVVNFANPFEAATEGAVRATVHRVKATTATSPVRYSIPFFQGVPLDMTLSEIRSYVPAEVRSLRHRTEEANKLPNRKEISTFLDPRWDNLGESQLRKWIRSHQDVGRKFYGDEVTEYYLQA